MNREQLSDAIGRLDDELVGTVDTRRRRSWWYTAVAVAACFCIVAGSLLAYSAFFTGEPAPVQGDLAAPTVTTTQLDEPTTLPKTTTTTMKSTTKTTTSTTKITENDTTARPTASPMAAVERMASPVYPQMVKWSADARSAWQKSRANQKAKVKGQSGGMTDFYTRTITTFLEGDPGENRVYSPLSVYLALSMLAEVTEGNSRQQVTDLLGVSNLSALRKKNAALWNGVYVDDNLTASRLGNSLWLDNGDRWQYDADTAERLAKYYYASVYNGEMGSDTYNKELQEWVNEQTNGLLKNHAQNLAFSPNTVLGLVSTVYYKAGWVGKFSEYATREEPFYAVSGELTCDFMHESAKTTAYFGENYTAVSKGMDDGSFQMTFFLPDEDVLVDEVIQNPQMVALLEGNTSGVRKKTMMVNMAVPKFDIMAEYTLNNGLKSLGVNDIFDENKSDFSGILEGGDGLYASASHAVRVKIDEEGGEAASYTVVTGAVRGTGQPPIERLNFTLDRPFVFAITGPGNTILFAGVVEKP